MSAERVTITLPAELIRKIARVEPNRSAFVLEAVRKELARRRRLELQRSLRKPHAEARDLTETGLGEWARELPAEDRDLVDASKGTPVRWTAKGWVAVKRK